MREYTGSVYVAVAESDLEYGEARDSIQNIRLRQYDEGPVFSRGTKGYEARQQNLDRFLDTRHDFILLLDGDQVFPVDCLERLRGHKLPYVSGLYMRRDYQPIAPIWFKPFSGHFPYEPWLDPIERGKLHHIGASGWGCVLLHREVVLAVRNILQGEPEIIEDDMDVYPYDLVEVTRSIAVLRSLVTEKPSMPILLPALDHHSAILESQIRPLRVEKRVIVGSDIRFPFYAMKAGYKLMGDPDCRCGHILNYPLGPDDYDQLPDDLREKVRRTTAKRAATERAGLRKLAGGLL
jgi:hypothetical protein